MTSFTIAARYFFGGVEGTHGKCRDNQFMALNFNQAPPRDRGARKRSG
jgi:hypothetical protein